nr:hypothetical protein [uncultured Desulfobulbus sp.]
MYEVVSSGMLELGGVNTLASGALLTVLSGNSSKLRIHGGDELELVNNGEIALHCSTELQQLGDGPALLSGHGTISLGVAGTGMTKLTGDAPFNGGQNLGFINGPGHTIRGAGSMYTDLVNQGEVIAENGYLVVSYPFHLSGTGNVQVNNEGWLDWWGDLSAHDFTMDATGRLWPNFSTPTLVLSGNFSFAQTDEHQWLADGKAARHSMTLQSRDGARQTLEIGGMDYGEDITGFNGYGAPNFDLSILTVSGTSTRVQLVDAVDNGNRSGQNEALYAWTLEVATGATLDLNCLSLYTWYNGAVHRVTDGDGHLFGGGEIIDTCGQSHHNLSPIMMLLLR